MKGLSQKQREQLKNNIVEYRKQGHLLKECAKHFGVKPSYVKTACRGVDFPWVRDVETMSNAAKEQAKNRHANDETIVFLLKNRNPSFEYVGGYVSSEGCADIRCKKCGCVFTRSYCSIKQGTVKCPDCYAKEVENRQRERERLLEEKRIQRNRDRQLNKKTVQTSFKVCPACKSVFAGRSVYCSETCRNHTKYMLREGYRYKFPLSEVYKRDNGICWLCGGLCDWNDYEEKDGVIVYGNSYPSRDHVIPKSKGGKNTWDNIRLAHRLCNSVKSNNVV